MATVTAFNAERMKEIEDSAIVGGTIVGGNLILTRHDGTQVNAGPVLEVGGQPFVGQYTTATRPDAFANAGKSLWDTDTQKFYKSNGSAWILAIRDVTQGTNILVDNSVVGVSLVSLVPSPAIPGSLSVVNGLSTGKAAGSGTAGARFEMYGISPTLDVNAAAGPGDAPVPLGANAIIYRILPHTYHSGLAYSTGDARFECISTEAHSPSAQGSRWRMWSKANGTTAAVEAHVWDHDGRYKAVRPLGGIGYGAGAGLTVTQLTSRITPVTINAVCGRIILFTTTMTTNQVNSFVVTNPTVEQTDVINVSIAGLNTSPGYYRAWVDEVVAGAFNLNVQNWNAATSPSEAVAINFALMRSVIA